MKDDYLWDRTGEPDPEVQELEDILGTLRYQPQPLHIPDGISVGRRRVFWPLAIAAVIALLAVGLGLWSTFVQRQGNPNEQVKHESNESPGTAAPVKKEERAAIKEPVDEPPTPRPGPYHLVKQNKARVRPVPAQPVLTAEQLAEREQVLLALRLASEKINFAQRKAQHGSSATPPSTIRNQHRIG